MGVPSNPFLLCLFHDDPLILKVTNCLAYCSKKKRYRHVVVDSPSQSKINEILLTMSADVFETLIIVRHKSTKKTDHVDRGWF